MVICMKIVQINTVNKILSTGRISYELTEELKQAGHEAYIAYSYGEKGGSGSYRIGNTAGKKLHALCSRITGLQAYFSTLSTIRFIVWLKKIKPDVVHLHNLHSNFIHLNLLLTYLSKNKIATVITLHDCWFFTGGCTHYSNNQCFQWQTGCKRCPNYENGMPSWFFDRSKKIWIDRKRQFERMPALAVVGVSDWITGEAKKSYLSHAKKITRIYNWVNLEVFHPTKEENLKAKLGLGDKFIILGVAAQWMKSKGIYDFIELSKILPKDCIIVLVGKWDGKIPLPPGIRNFQHIHKSADLARIYSMSDVLVSLSTEESFGMIVAEALACATPAIVRSATASPELIGDHCGYVSKNNSINNIFEDIMRVKENTKSNYSPYCRRFAEKNFDMHCNIHQYCNLYEELLQQDKKDNTRN